jgi:hypothetical protein
LIVYIEKYRNGNTIHQIEYGKHDSNPLKHVTCRGKSFLNGYCHGAKDEIDNGHEDAGVQEAFGKMCY